MFVFVYDIAWSIRFDYFYMHIMSLQYLRKAVHSPNMFYR